MKILFTGASSFTGYWFVSALAERGHTVTAVFQKERSEYEEIRQKRVEKLGGCCRQVFGCAFGSDAFLSVIESQPEWDLLCHHAADVTNCKSIDFDTLGAVTHNTHNIPNVLSKLQKAQCQRVLVTGSVFEPDEGKGAADLCAFSPYALSKAMTWQMFRYYASVYEMVAAKFVIPNPFGPYEEFRFTSYLAKSWLEGKTPTVSTTNYVRDNIPVSLLARAYVRFAERFQTRKGALRYAPSGYAETQGAFTARLAGELRQRLNIPCAYELLVQRDFSEPMARMNTENVMQEFPDWLEEQAWDELAHYYQATYGALALT